MLTGHNTVKTVRVAQPGMHEHQERILELLAHHDGARFGALKRFVDLRSNKLSYHLNQLQTDGLLEKADEEYRLTDAGTALVPYLGHDQQPLDVVLVAPVDGDTVWLAEREKDAYRGMYAIPSETVEYGETPDAAVDRLEGEYNLDLGDVTYRKTVVEIDHRDGAPQHHFTFLVHQATPAQPPARLEAFRIDTLDREETVIPTDARIVQTLDDPSLAVVGMDLDDRLTLRE